MNNRKNLALVLLLVFALFTSGFQTPVLAANQEKQGTITVIGTDAANPLLPETTVQFGESETATQALVNAVGESNIEFTDTTYGKMLTGIKGEKAEGTHFWAFFINGVSAQVGADNYVVHNGDQLTFRLTDWNKTPESMVSLKVVNGDKKIVNNLSDIEVIGTPTAFQLLQVALGPEKVGFSESQYGKMITSINGLEAEGTNYWAFYIDGQMATVGADSYPLKPGNQISFQFESWADVPEDGGNGGDGQPNPTPPAGTVSDAALQTAIDAVSQYALKSPIGEWEAISLKQAGKTIPASYLEAVKALVKEREGKFTRITDTERYVLGILAAGGDPTNIEGYDLVQAIYNGNVTKQGLIGVSYALIALDSAGFSVPADALWTKDKLVNYLAEKQNADGGWAWDESSTSDIDTTAMIVTALAPYRDQAGVKEKVDAAIEYLAAQYQASKIDNSSTAAQVIIALSALGMDANASLFAKDNSSLLQYFLSFQNADGGFDWQGGYVSDVFTTSQAFQALVAYQLFSQGKGSLYHLPLIAEQKPDVENPEAELPEVESPEPERPQVEETSLEKEKPEETVKGHTLPNTASNMYNLLAIGLFLMVAGSAFYLKQRKRKA
ncbi:DUF4430 domain-containing protein [Neobacillus vireti]|uniref:Cell wall anchor domain-containing protein n=1 Tax=Neobacillus vireti LMG 21834 TaxID=1131730 RepID=A0AB94IL18_9BACI|nr:DUF4430 domain-containing protein [Neobacillus vireti]ETI67734.1 cell wall anchor domain-containing protein [Neobacillus vireti LMG 21834]